MQQQPVPQDHKPVHDRGGVFGASTAAYCTALAHACMVGALHIHGQQGEASTGPTHTCVGSRDVVDMQPFQVFVNITVFLLGLILVIKCSDSISISRAVGLVVVQSQSQSQSRPAPNLGNQSPTLTLRCCCPPHHSLRTACTCLQIAFASRAPATGRTAPTTRAPAACQEPSPTKLPYGPMSFTQ